MEQRLTSTQQDLRDKDKQKENLQSQLKETEQRLTSTQQDLRGKDEQKENFQSRGRTIQQRLRSTLQDLIGKDEQKENLQSQLRDKEQQLTSTQQDLREKDEQKENLQSQLRDMEQQLTSTQQDLREKDEQKENLQSQLRDMEQQLTSTQQDLREKDGQKENLQSQLRDKEQQLTSTQQDLREKDEQKENLQSQLRDMEQQLTSTQQDLREKDEQKENLQSQLRDMEQQLTKKEAETANLQHQITTYERQMRAKDQEVNELETTLSTAQQALRGENQVTQSPDWVISRYQIQLTDKTLGSGAWGMVVEGRFCGCAVAVKQIHELILSPRIRILFEREMNIASRCRHPCLLQFIGATNDKGSPLFVTELMESSLRALLEQRHLAETEVSIISLDVAQALSYLHQKSPPIIHRDISSANVLLWRRGDQWRGKLSDYGTANFMQKTMTVAPGAVIYSAPEALTSSQTVKVDVFSFGVLLCEMCIRDMPDPQRRDQQIAMVTNRWLRALVRRCVQTEPGLRPNMEAIIVLKNLNI
ncbi:uncharacterized protein LOC144642920 isoform X2 [Oculina patagonica]